MASKNEIIAPVPVGFDIKFETINNLKNLMPSYDKKYDTFFVTQNPPVPAASIDWNGEIWIRVASNGDIVGFEVENFEKVFLAKNPDIIPSWKQFKRICLENERVFIRKPEVKKTDICEMFLMILLNFISNLFRSHPQQAELLSA